MGGSASAETVSPVQLFTEWAEFEEHFGKRTVELAQG